MSAPQFAPNLSELLPGSIAKDPQLRPAALAVQPALDDVQRNIVQAEIFSRIDELSLPVLRLLAWENRVDGAEWVLAKTIEDKRALVKNSFELNQRRGTRWAIERVFALLRLVPEITEWWQEDATPGTWRVSLLDVGQRGLDSSEFGYIFELVDQYRPVSRHLTSIHLAATPETAAVHAAALLDMSVLVTCEPAPKPDYIATDGGSFAAMAAQIQSVSVEVNPAPQPMLLVAGGDVRAGVGLAMTGVVESG